MFTKCYVCNAELKTTYEEEIARCNTHKIMSEAEIRTELIGELKEVEHSIETMERHREEAPFEHNSTLYDRCLDRKAQILDILAGLDEPNDNEVSRV